VEARAGAFSLVAWIDAVARARPARPAILDGSRTITYNELWGRAERVAYGLLQRPDISPGSRIALLGRNDAEFLIAYLGALRAGCVAVPLNHLLVPRDLASQLAFGEVARCVVCAIDDERSDAAAAVTIVEALAELDGTAAAPLPTVDSTDPATVLLTSGTTGSPKGVVHTHGTLLHAALLIAGAFPFAPDDVTIAFLPFFASIPEHVLPALLSSAALDVLPRFDPEAVSEASARATSFDAVPTLMASLLDEADLTLLNRLRWVMFASEPMPPPLLERWWEALPNVDTYELYGMTEMLTITYAPPATLHDEPRCVGHPFPTSQIQMLDELGQALEPAQEGEVACASPARMKGYFQASDATNASLTASGAMRTGDLGRFDDEGRLHLTGRLKDLIISGGLNIAPAEIEAAACRHPAVATASVIGIPHPRWGETPVVLAVAKRDERLGANDLLEHCRTELGSFKRPSAAAVVDKLPTTGIGKSAKAELRDAVLRGEIPLVRAKEVELGPR
jgi:acyl-CoA synthetase (AMP-forming)/AMP-acid ligase II